MVGSLFLLNKTLLKWHCYRIVVSSYLNMHTFHVELYVEYFLGVRLQNYNVFDTFFVTFIRQLYHCCDVVLMVAQEVCGM